jgi:23S rRNA pseudouridine2605 synthase
MKVPVSGKAPAAARPAGERLQKVLAAAGLGSRRAIEDWIRAGRVTIDGRVAALGDRVQPDDAVAVDGRPVPLAPAAAAGPAALLVYHKPLGEVTTRKDPAGRPTVFERLPPPAAGRWIVVGRLDVNTTGLLLFTTDGELAHRLMHPSSEVEREYLVRVRGQPSAQVLQQLRSGILLEDGWARFERIEAEGASEGHAWFRVVLREGRNREVRRLWSAAGHEVSRLTRVRYGSVTLPRDLPPGHWRSAPASELDALRRAVAAAR